jgi:hypothetical protein|tara:strand:- start:106 stop:585 length:480 start_codon:yes stop_codon:yes gene_type:complete
MNDREIRRLMRLARHIDNVRNYCNILGQRLAENGEAGLGHGLIANGYIHDNSKFHGVEWLYLHEDEKEQNPTLFKAALLQHTTTNLHHPEAWDDGIHAMPRLYLAEFVCDISARSSEFGNDIRDWVKKQATKKYDMTVQSKTYKEIKDLLGLLLDEPYK